LLKLFDYHNERSKDILEWGTLKNYFTTKKYIIKFLKHRLKKQDISLSELKFKFLTDFEYFMRKYQPVDHHKPMGNNTVMKHIERLRKVINMGVDLEWLSKDPFARFKKHFEKTAKDKRI
jgi:integrase/recombinase XerD